MNFDELQQQWKDENTDNVQITKELNILKQAQSPIDEVRKSMKMELKVMLLLTPFLIIIPIIPIYKIESYSKLVYYMMLILGFSGSYFYYRKFSLFYKQTNQISINSSRNLLAIYYDLRSLIDIYKAVSYAITPYFTITFVIVISFGKSEAFFVALTNLPESFSDNKFLLIGMSIAIIAYIPFTIRFTESWIEKYYGKHLTQIKKVLDELDEE
jgi:hypothetical protein